MKKYYISYTWLGENLVCDELKKWFIKRYSHAGIIEIGKIDILTVVDDIIDDCYSHNKDKMNCLQWIHIGLINELSCSVKYDVKKKQSIQYIKRTIINLLKNSGYYLKDKNEKNKKKQSRKFFIIEKKWLKKEVEKFKAFCENQEKIINSIKIQRDENIRKYTIEKEINNSLFKKNLELQRKIKEVQKQYENTIKLFERETALIENERDEYQKRYEIEQKFIAENYGTNKNIPDYNDLVLELRKRNEELENIKNLQKKLAFCNFILPNCTELEGLINKIKESECRILNLNKFEQKFNENKSDRYYVCDDTYEKMELIYNIIKKYIRKNFGLNG